MISGNDTDYDYIYSRISTNGEVRAICLVDVASGCSFSAGNIILPQTALNVWYSDSKSLKRSTGEELTYEISWPEDCYTTTIILHEFSHALQGLGLSGDVLKTVYILPVWFREHVSGFAELEGANLVCGEGTVGNYNKDNLVKFLSEFPPADIAHDYPSSECSQAAMVNVLLQVRGSKASSDRVFLSSHGCNY